MPSDIHAIDCRCRACTGPRSSAQHWVAHRHPRRRRLAVALLGLAVVIACSLLLLL